MPPNEIETSTCFAQVSEVDRLIALESLGIFGTSPEPAFDALTQVAALACDAPISLISLIDKDRQWFKSNIGLESVSETSRKVAFCSHTIERNGLFEVSDALQDDRFADNPLVTGAPGIRFYAGVPLRLSNGAAVGALCVVDRQRRTLTPAQRSILSSLADVAVIALEQRQLAQKQARNEARFRLLSELSPVGVFATDATGSCSYTNRAYRAIHGVSEQEALGQQWVRSIHPEDRNKVFACWSQAEVARTNVDIDFRIHTPQGVVRNVRTQAQPMFDDGGKLTGYVGTLEDVTKAMTKARASTALMAVMQENFLVSIADLEGNVLEVSDSFCAATGYSRAELLGCDLSVLNSGLHTTNFMEEVRGVLRDQVSWRGEMCTRCKDGQLRWYDTVISLIRDSTGTPMRYVTIQQDITNSKSLNEALRKSEELLSRTAQVANVGGWEIDLLEGRPVWSAQTCRIHGVPTGYRPKMDEAIRFFAPEARPVIEAAVQDALDGHSNGWDLKLPFLPLNAKNRWVHAIGTVDRENGRPVRIFGTIQDVTEQMERQHALTRVQTRLELATQAGRIGVWEWDVVANDLVWDERMYGLYGLSAGSSDKAYEQWTRHLHPKDSSRVQAEITAALRGECPFDTEFRIVQPNGAVRQIKARGHVTRNFDGAPLSIVGVSWDITKE